MQAILPVVSRLSCIPTATVYDAADLFQAIATHNSKKVKRIVTLCKTDYQYVLDTSGCPPICAAAKTGYVDLVTLLLRNGFCAHIPDDRCWFPVHYAASNNNCDVIYVLVNRGDADVTRKCPVDTCPCQKQSALHAAAMNGQYDAVMALINCGADVNATDFKHRTAEQVAREKGHTEVAELLHRYADVKA